MDHIQVDLDIEDEKCRTLWCGNLSDKVTEDLLYELFLQAGPLESVYKVPQTTFAFVLFVHSVSVEYSIHLMEGVSLFGKLLKLQHRNITSENHSKKKFQDHIEWNTKLNETYQQKEQKYHQRKQEKINQNFPMPHLMYNNFSVKPFLNYPPVYNQHFPNNLFGMNNYNHPHHNYRH